MGQECFQTTPAAGKSHGNRQWGKSHSELKATVPQLCDRHSVMAHFIGWG